MPTRYHLRPEDVRMDLLRPTSFHTECPFKGQASYWDPPTGDAVHDGIVWSYETPIPWPRAITGLIVVLQRPGRSHRRHPDRRPVGVARRADRGRPSGGARTSGRDRSTVGLVGWGSPARGCRCRPIWLLPSNGSPPNPVSPKTVFDGGAQPPNRLDLTGAERLQLVEALAEDVAQAYLEKWPPDVAAFAALRMPNVLALRARRPGGHVISLTVERDRRRRPRRQWATSESAEHRARSRRTSPFGLTPGSGAGGNRTLVRRVVTTRATTIPGSRPYGCRTAGSVELALTAGSFPDVSGLSRRQRSLPAVLHCFCCRAAVDRPRVPLLVAVTLYRLTRSGCESELAIGGSLGAPFKESEQLRSHDAAPGPNVETDQPLDVRELLDEVVNPPEGGHPRVAVARTNGSGHPMRRHLSTVAVRRCRHGEQGAPVFVSPGRPGRRGPSGGGGRRTWPGPRRGRRRAWRSPGACRTAPAPARCRAPPWPARP